jgi:hypothetical protein
VVARVRIPLGALTAEDPAALRATMMISFGFSFRSAAVAAERGKATLRIRGVRYPAVGGGGWPVPVSLLPSAIVGSSRADGTEEKERRT